MFEGLSLEAFLELADQGKRVVVYKEVPLDLFGPIFAYQALSEEGQVGFLLESNEISGAVGRYSFMGFNPKVVLTSYGKQCTIQTGEKIEKHTGDPLNFLREIIKDWKTISSPFLPPMIGGAVGFMSYDSVRLFEEIPDRHKDIDKYPDLYFAFYDTMIAFDHFAKKIYLTHIVEIEDTPRVPYRKAVDFLTNLLQKILSYQLSQKNPVHLYEPAQSKNSSGKVEVDISDQDYEKIVLKAQEYIRAGDIFQIVPSRRFMMQHNCRPFDIYRALRIVNPSPYMFFLDNVDYVITGASPERLVSLQDKTVQTMPIAGTRPRGTEGDDLQKEQELLQDPKEIAEHMMLVDLARNDLGRISKPGSVFVKSLKQIQRFSHVMHIVSTVQGTLLDGLDALDALKVTLPAGTLSGAPKIRAMEIIDELETSRRGLYGGAICYIDSRGNLDSCIAIRMACLKGNMATIRAGGGVVFDSNPHSEMQESWHKSQAVIRAIQLASGGF